MLHIYRYITLSKSCSIIIREESTYIPVEQGWQRKVSRRMERPVISRTKVRNPVMTSREREREVGDMMSLCRAGQAGQGSCIVGRRKWVGTQCNCVRQNCSTYTSHVCGHTRITYLSWTMNRNLRRGVTSPRMYKVEPKIE